MTITIHTLSIGQPQQHQDERGEWRSAIFRTPVAGPVELSERGLAGDQVADTANHGSTDQAVCCHPIEHYAFWNQAYGLEGDARLGPGAVGENWTLTGTNEQQACAGDILSVGSAVVQVSAPRYPCTKQDRKLGLAGFQRRTVETLRTGFYLRVLQPGTVQAGDQLTLIERPRPDLTIERLNQHCHHAFDLALAQQLLEAPELGWYWKRIMGIMIERKGQG